MFISSNLVFLELHKTGTTHVQKILDEVLDGDIRGKHNQLKRTVFDQNTLYLGSIWNPWAWYCSLWSYGCDSAGMLYGKLTRTRRRLGRPLHWMSRPRETYGETLRLPSKDWRETYRDARDPEAFRTWLKMLLDSPHRRDIGEGYGSSPVSSVCGLMTYRYLRLFCTFRGEDAALKKLLSAQEVERYEQQNNFITHFVRTESLERDLFAILSESGITLSDAAEDKVLNMPKTNSSVRPLGLADYYDEETAALVARKDWILIDKFGYRLE
ncbi:hypothetical protein [uncultured Shimia sp.]|uniref:hypothetical protein n=1 Tax=uncultured Shimia sp. TaxID=573152 RepID=UPI002623CEC1|nr:hypothetical protein [uncultured Shimia sp.]